MHDENKQVVFPKQVQLSIQTMTFFISKQKQDILTIFFLDN